MAKEGFLIACGFLYEDGTCVDTKGIIVVSRGPRLGALPGNPLVADLLRRIHMVEAWGRGMPLILKNAPDAKFREVAGLFVTTFDRPSFSRGAKSDGVLSNEAVESTTEKTTEKDLSATEKAILDLLMTRPTITQKEMGEEIGLTEDGIYYHMHNLKKKNRLRRVGGKRFGRWEVLG